MFSGDTVMHSYGSGKEFVNAKLPSVSAAEGSEDVNSDHPLVKTGRFRVDLGPLILINKSQT